MLTVRPCSLVEANRVVSLHHSHHRPVVGHRFSISAWGDGEMVGVIIVGNPVAPALCDGTTFEVTRLCVIGHHPNAASKLLGAAWRAARAMGVLRMVSYTRADEHGGCYQASGWRVAAAVRGRAWDTGNKSTRWLPGFYEPTTEIVDRTRWEIS